MLETRPISSAMTIRTASTDDCPALPAAVEQQIEATWKAENAKRSSGLFNGPVLSFVSLEGDTIEARVTDYRHFLAQKRAPELFEVLAIRPLAVSGVVAFGSKIAFGKRAGNTTQDAGRWELVPSGGLTPRAVDEQGNISAKVQVLEELKEELGLPASHVGSARPFLLIEDVEAHVIDIGFDITLSANQSDLDNAMLSRTDEYSEIQWVEMGEIGRFCDGKARDVIPVSLALLKAKLLSF
jgi:hypothetical protein